MTHTCSMHAREEQYSHSPFPTSSDSSQRIPEGVFDGWVRMLLELEFEFDVVLRQAGIGEICR